MLLQVYYFSMCLYGWRCWQAGAHAAAEKKTLPVSRIAPGKWLGVMASTVLLFLVLGAFMHCFTNSDVPWIDSLATALSFVATWMLARKKIENWLFWIVADVLSIGLYCYISYCIIKSTIVVCSIKGFVAKPTLYKPSFPSAIGFCPSGFCHLPVTAHLYVRCI